MAKSVSTGCVVASVIGAFFLLAAIALVVFVGLGYLTYRRSAPSAPPPLAGTPSSSPSAAAPGSAETPTPTPEQTRALDGGKLVAWKDHGLSWTVPADWNVEQDTPEVFTAKSPGSFDAGWLLASVSPPFDTSFPAETSLNAMHEQAVDNVKTGEYESARWLALDGVRGVEFVEKEPATPSDVRRIEWTGYVTRGGRPVLITLMAHSSGKGFVSHSDALHAVLYSTKVSK